MVGKQNSTILTVSYGTFSCTLEGFDDSFGTMKAIAEYFRDLAADDRYFGAEPPTPDADMLAKIAEQEVSRRVEARSENGGIVLRPQQIEDAAPVVEDTPEPVLEPAPAPKPVAKTAPAPVAYVEEDDDAFFGGEAHGAMLDEESVAARLKRIREAARHSFEDDQVEDAVEEAVEDTFEDDDFMDTPDVEVATETDEPEAFVDEVADDEEANAQAEELLYDDELIDEIKDALSENVQSETDDEPEVVVEDEDSFDEVEDVQTEDTAEREDIFEVDEEATDPEFDEDFNALMEQLDESSSDEEQGFEDDAEDAAEPVQARILHVKGAALQDMENFSEDDLIGYDDDAYEAGENEVDAAKLDAIFEDTEDKDDASSLSPEDEADLMRELAEAEAEETTDEFEDSDEDNENVDWGDLLDADTEAVVSDEEHLFTGDPEEALATAQDLSSLLTDREADDEMGRLMAETETQLTEPEHKKRKTTIQHLKAAFAARRADGNDLDAKSGNDSVPYREDLEQAVKPRRPVLGRPRKTERLEAKDAAPLKLVAAQKVVPEGVQSEPAARPTLVKPVRPRRVRGGSAAVAEEFDVDAVASEEASEPKVDFATYAEQMGVSKLPELLEAAAAFMTHVEGYEKFSRPQIMTIVREVMGDDYTREDGLRAFGQLLREGKLIRLSGGRFTVSDGIGFQPN